MDENLETEQSQSNKKNIKYRTLILVTVVILVVVVISVVISLFNRQQTSIVMTPPQDSDQVEVGKTALRDKYYSDAVNNFQMALNKDVDNAEIQALLAIALAAQADATGGVLDKPVSELYAESMVHFEKALELGYDETFSSYDDFLFRYLTAAIAALDVNKSEKIYSEILTRDPVAVKPRVRMGDAYINLFANPEAARSVLLPIFTFPNNINPSLYTEANFLMMRLSTYYEELDDVEKYAANALAGELDVMDLALVHTNLAGVYSMRGDVEKAKETIEKAEEILNEPGRFTCNLAYVYYVNKNFDSALEEAKKREHPICWSIMGKVYLEYGDKVEARKYAQKSLDAIIAIETKDIFAVRGIKTEEEILKKTE